MMSEGQMWELAVLRRQELWHPEPPRRARRGGAALLVLAGLASAGAACGLAGDGSVPVGCAHFVTTVRTSEPSYAPGQTVITTVTQANDGPACTLPPQPCGPPVALASAYNPAGKDVWDAGAQKTFEQEHSSSPPRQTSSLSGNALGRSCFRILSLNCAVWSADVHGRRLRWRVVDTQLVTRPFSQPGPRPVHWARTVTAAASGPQHRGGVPVVPRQATHACSGCREHGSAYSNLLIRRVCQPRSRPATCRLTCQNRCRRLA